MTTVKDVGWSLGVFFEVSLSGISADFSRALGCSYDGLEPCRLYLLCLPLLPCARLPKTRASDPKKEFLVTGLHLANAGRHYHAAQHRAGRVRQLCRPNSKLVPLGLNSEFHRSKGTCWLRST